MFWLRSKKNNLLLHTLIWGPALVVVIGLFLILYFPCWFLDRLGCKLNAEYQQIKNWDSQREIVIVTASWSFKGIVVKTPDSMLFTLIKYGCRLDEGSA